MGLRPTPFGASALRDRAKAVGYESYLKVREGLGRLALPGGKR
jgi:hypothetical protein